MTTAGHGGLTLSVCVCVCVSVDSVQQHSSLVWLRGEIIACLQNTHGLTDFGVFARVNIWS